MYDTDRLPAPREDPPQGPQEGEFFSVADLLQAVGKRAWLVALVAVLAAGAAVGASVVKPPVYEASATVVVGPKDPSPPDNISNTISGLQMLAHEMAVVGLTRPMAEGVVASQSGLVSAEDLNENLTVEQVEDTRFLSLSYQDNDPTRAQAVVNDAARVFVEGAAEANGMASGAALKVASYAPEPVALEGPSPVRNGLLALALGLMLGVGLAFLLERFGGKKRGPAKEPR